MKLVAVACCLLILSCHDAHAQATLPSRGIGSVTDTFGFAKSIHRPFRKNNFKVEPAFLALALKGVTLSYETGLGVWPFSMQFSSKFFKGSDSSNTNLLQIRPHWRFEFQPRFWGIHYMDGIFMAPLFDVYDNFDLAIGGLFGYQHFLADFLLFEAYVGVQSSNSTEKYDSPIFLRYGLSLGYSFYHRKN